MKTRLSMLVVVMMVVTSLLAACSNNNASNEGNNANTTGNSTNEEAKGANNDDNDNKDKVEIRLSTWAGADEAKELQAILDELNEQSDTYTIIQDSNPAEYDTRLITQLSGSNGPDLFWINAQRASQFAAEGVMLDITDRLDASTHDAGQISDYYEASLQPFTHEDRIYGLPWLQQPVMLYVNQSLFEEAGVDLPDDSWTWDDFIEAATKLTKDSEGRHPGEDGFDEESIVQWGFTLNGWPPSQIFIWQNDGEVLTEDGQSPIDSPEAMEALNFYADLVNGPLTPSQQIIRDRGFDTMFREKQVAMFMGGAADDLDSTVESVQAYVTPAGNNGTHATLADILGMGINVKTKHADEAFEALLDLSDAIHHWKIMPPRKSLADLESLQELHPKKSHSLEAIIASMEFARPYRYSEKYPDWDNLYWTQLMDPIVNAGGNPEEIVPNVKPLLEDAMK